MLHVLSTVDGGGVAQPCVLARHAVRSGGAAVVAAPGVPRHEAADAAREAGVEVVPLPPAGRARSAAVLRLARDADLVHVHGMRAAAWSLPAIVRRASVVTLHGLHALRRPAGRGYRLAARGLLTAVGAAADAVICVSEADAADLRRLAWARRVRVVRNAVPERPPVSAGEREAARAELGVPDGRLTVLVPGRLHEQKDPLTALRVARLLGDEAVVLVAGDGDLAGPVRAGAGPNVRLLGHVPELRPVLAASDVVLSTALWEGLPLTLLEAMWAGRPIVASRVPGNVEAVGDAALLVPPGDAEAFAAALRGLADEGRRAELAARARDRVARVFALDEMLRATDAVYDEVCGR